MSTNHGMAMSIQKYVFNIKVQVDAVMSKPYIQKI